MLNLKRPAGMLLLALTPACTATYRVAPAQYVPQKSPDEIFVLDNAGFMYALEQPAIVGEKITGIQRGTSDTVSLAISRVTEAMVRRKSPVRTAILIGSLTAAGTGIAIFARGKGESCKLIYAQDDVPGKDSECDTSDVGLAP
jgi:hypothetical protein